MYEAVGTASHQHGLEACTEYVGRSEDVLNLTNMYPKHLPGINREKIF
jgi:hypothetical protein